MMLRVVALPIFIRKSAWQGESEMSKRIVAKGRAAIAAACPSTACLLFACLLVLGAGTSPASAQEADRRQDYLLHETHLPDGTMQLTFGLGQTFYDGFSERALAGQFTPFRWGVTERVNLIFPLMASYLAVDSPRQRVVVIGGLKGFGFSSTEGFITDLGAAGLYEYLPAPEVVWAWGATLRHLQAWGSQDNETQVVLGLNRAQTFGDRWIVAAGISASHNTRGTLALDDDIPAIAIGSAGGMWRPLVQLRVWRGFHLYASSKLSLFVHDPLADVHGHLVHQHVGGFNWYY